MRIEVSVRRLALLILALALVSAQGADYYVSTQGSDSNPGTSAQPFRTITRAYGLAGPGTTIIVLPGVYTDYQSGWGLHLGRSGTASSPITLRSQVRGGAIIDGQNASDRNVAIYLDGSYNIVDGFEIRGGPLGGITIWGNYNQILNNKIHHNGNPASTSPLGQDGIYSGENTRDTVYRGNTIHDNGRTGSNLDHALYLCGDNEVVINNVLIRNAAYGVHIAGYTTVSNMKVYNNVMAHNGKSGIILWMPVSGVDIKNNIIYQNGKFGIDSYDAHGSGVVIDRNLVFGNSLGNYGLARDGSDFTYTLGTTISSAPLFVNSTSAGFDAHLSAGSPAINAALNLSSVFTTDLDGALRPASGSWDLGAYKYGNADTTAPTISLTAPANNATVSGVSVTVSANASDNVGVAGVQFKLNGANLGAEDTTAPYSVVLNTTTLADGTHTLSAVARDAAGNQTTANSVAVVVSNVVTLPTVTVAATDANASEAGLDAGLFTITRTGGTTSALTVNFTRGGTATSGTDYATLATSLTLPIGAASAAVLVTPIDDLAVEGAETVVFTLAVGSTYNIGSSSSATVTIADNDSTPPLPTVTVTTTDASATEGGTDSAVFTFTRSGSTALALTVNYNLSGNATQWNDYRRYEGDMPVSITIPAGASSATLTVYGWDDTEVEGSENVILTIASDATYIVGSPSNVTVTIADNDSTTTLPTVTVVATDANAGEAGPNPGVFTISRTGDTTLPLIVNYALSGTASNGIDYMTLGGSVTIPAGSASVTVMLTPISDSRNESTETVILTLAANASYTDGSPNNATVNIANARRVKKQTDTAVTDGDGDGMSDANELIAGTDSNDALSVLQLSSISATGSDGLELTWRSVAGKTYRVAFSETVNDEYWTDLSEDIFADGSISSWRGTNASLGTIRFYSVTVVN
jgi:Big-like domain-containing protein/parallel beta helix pectate lyase-like protein/Calx-beta domain-containing protein/uncharacterized protein DUF1565